jgi:S-adenosylmethionine uptake transporter
MTRPPVNPAIPFAVAGLGIALFSVMDALMKGLALAAGAYNAMLWRIVLGAVIGGAIFVAVRAPWPPKERMRLHLIRGSVAPVMAFTFFWGIARVPLAEGLALSFIAPLIALYLAAVLLGEKISSKAITGSVLGLAGVGIILASKLGEAAHGNQYWMGVGAIFISAVFYAYNIVLQRQQALVSLPTEIVFFQHLVASCVLLSGAVIMTLLPADIGPDLGLKWPPMGLWRDIILSVLLTIGALWFLAWAYARAEAQLLVSLEYTAFIWASIFGWLFFHERVTLATLGGTALIVTGCVIAARARPEVSSV